MSRSLLLDISPQLVRWTRLYPKIIAAQYNHRCEICLRARYSSEVLVQYKVVRVLNFLGEHASRPP